MSGSRSECFGDTVRRPADIYDTPANIHSCPLDMHELMQERLYVAARLGRIDRTAFAKRAMQLEKQRGNCNYLNWLIRRHPDVPQVDFPKKEENEPSKRDLRRSRCPWRAKAMARNQKKRNSGKQAAGG